MAVAVGVAVLEMRGCTVGLDRVSPPGKVSPREMPLRAEVPVSTAAGGVGVAAVVTEIFSIFFEAVMLPTGSVTDSWFCSTVNRPKARSNIRAPVPAAFSNWAGTAQTTFNGLAVCWALSALRIF